MNKSNFSQSPSKKKKKVKKTIDDFEDIDKNTLSGGDLGKGAYGR